MITNTEKQPSAGLTSFGLLCIEQRSLSEIALMCIAVVSGERFENLADICVNLRADDDSPLAYLKEKDAASRAFAVKMGCLLRMVAIEYLKEIGCPESTIETNLKFITDTIAVDHQRLV